MPLRVAMLHQREGGGATVALAELSAGLSALGHEVCVVTPAEGEALSAVMARIDACNPSVVHAHCFYNALAYEDILEVAQRWPLLWTLHDTLPVNQFGPECWECFRNAWCLGCPALGAVRRWRPNYRVLARLARRRVNKKLRAHLVLPSQWMRRRIARTELAALPWTHIPYGMDCAGLAGVANTEAAAAAASAALAPTVLFAGNMYSAQDHRKGLPDLLQAWSEVRAALPQARLVVAGIIAAGLLPATVDSAGDLPRAQLVELMAQASVVCVPSRGDNLPLTVIEAMAAGRCVVATQIGGIPEMIEHNVSGLLVPAANPPALAQALLAALRDPALAARLGHAAQLRAQAEWSQSLCAQRHEQLYAQLAQTPHAGVAAR